MKLRFEVPGEIPSNNRVTRNVAGRSVKSAEAREYQARVASIAKAAVLAQGWKLPAKGAKLSVDLYAFGTRLDVDNIAKCLLDGMAGVVYDNDRAIIGLFVAKFSDNKPRIEIEVGVSE